MYILTTGNLIKIEDQQNINDRIDMINQLDSGGIRKLQENDVRREI